MRMEVVRLQEGTVRSLELRLSDSERAVQTLASEKASVQLDLDARSEKCRQLEAYISELKARHADETSDRSRLRALVQDLEMELETVRHNVSFFSLHFLRKSFLKN